MSRDVVIAAIDTMVEQKLLSMEGLRALEQVRSKAEAQARALEELGREKDNLRLQLETARAQNTELAAAASAVKDREIAVTKREAGMVALEKSTAVAEAVSAAQKDMVALIFRNVEVRNSVFSARGVGVPSGGFVQQFNDTQTGTQETK